MEDIGPLLGDIINTNFDVNTEHWVRLTHITNPLDFYVLPIKYWEFIKRLEATLPQIKPSALNLHDVVIFNKNNSDEPIYARGKILRIENEGNLTKYDIFALDYGCFCKAIPEEYIWECNENYARIPPLAVACQLANCGVVGGKEWSYESIDAFKSYVGDERVNMLILEKALDKLTVELTNSNPHDIATLMALTEFSSLGFLNNAISRCSKINPEKKCFTFKKLQINDILRVRVQSGNSLKQFYVVEVNDYKNYLEECDNITYYARQQRTLPEEHVKKDTIVLVKNDINRYDRAIIQEVIVPDTKCKVKLVDTGEEVVAYNLNMRTMSKQCLKLPVSTIYCYTEESQAWDNGLHRFLYPGFEFLIKIKQLGNKLETPNFVKIAPLK